MVYSHTGSGQVRWIWRDSKRSERSYSMTIDLSYRTRTLNTTQGVTLDRL
ncbi:hypothetical protein CJF30_00004524 [Rutstroemia sp. NJR-2017a BBW]|nr:hypothetical protein CJF30_00004524 [Rutstroemia sp. NJR-2017a BBW]